MAEILYSLLLIGIGILNLFYSIKFIRDPTFAKRYIEKSPKAWIWRKLFGVKKSLQITKKFFAPLGIIVGIVFIILGITLFIF